MINPRVMLGALVFCLLAGGPARAQLIYFNTSSSVLAANTLDALDSEGTGRTPLLTATGLDFNQILRCTAVAVDELNGRLFFVDGSANALWGANLDGSGLAKVKGSLTTFPTDLALDVLNQRIYYTTSSTIQGNNTVQVMDYTGSNNATVFTAAGGTGVYRCTALAVDVAHAKIFLADAGTNKIWSLTLTGGGLTPLASTTNAVPTDLTVDTANQRVYFTASSPVQGFNRIERVNYSGGGLTTLYTAAGSVQRCTALDVDVPRGLIYLSDAGSNAPVIWQIPLGGGSPLAILSGLSAPAKKLRWFSGPTNRPPPGLTGIQLAGSSVKLNATNGYIGGTYFILTSTNLAAPLSQWLPIATNVLGASGNFALNATNGFNARNPRQFYILRVQ